MSDYQLLVYSGGIGHLFSLGILINEMLCGRADLLGRSKCNALLSETQTEKLLTISFQFNNIGKVSETLYAIREELFRNSKIPPKNPSFYKL